MLFDLLTEGLDDRRTVEADITFAVYVRPLNARGLHVVRIQGTDRELVVASAAGRKTHKPGTIVPLGSHTGTPGKFILSTPPPGRRGAENVPVLRQSLAADFVRIVSADPAEVDQGVDDQAVVFGGAGFATVTPDIFEAVIFDEDAGGWVAHPLIAIHDVVPASAIEVAVQVDVDPAVPAGTLLGIQVSRANVLAGLSALAAPSLAPDLLTVVVAGAPEVTGSDPTSQAWADGGVSLDVLGSGFVTFSVTNVVAIDGDGSPATEISVLGFVVTGDGVIDLDIEALPAIITEEDLGGGFTGFTAAAATLHLKLTHSGGDLEAFSVHELEEGQWSSGG